MTKKTEEQKEEQHSGGVMFEDQVSYRIMLKPVALAGSGYEQAYFRVTERWDLANGQIHYTFRQEISEDEYSEFCNSYRPQVRPVFVKSDNSIGNVFPTAIDSELAEIISLGKQNFMDLIESNSPSSVQSQLKLATQIFSSMVATHGENPEQLIAKCVQYARILTETFYPIERDL